MVWAAPASLSVSAVNLQTGWVPRPVGSITCQAATTASVMPSQAVCIVCHSQSTAARTTSTFL